MGYSAGIIIEEENQPVFRKGGDARIVGMHIIFEADGKAIELPITGCHIKLGGTANKQAYVTHPKKPDITLQVNDFGLFRDEAFAGHDEAKRFQTDKNKHHGMLYGTVIAIFLCILVPFYMVFIERDFLVSKITEAVPPRYDVQLGDLLAPSKDDLITDQDILDDLDAMTAPLIEAARLEPFEYNLHIVKNSQVNAYAIPGGHILINVGLIEKTETPEELLGVIAHEIAHINQRHSMKRLIHSLSGWVFMSLLGADPNHVIALLGNQVGTLSQKGYSRDNETEADHEGFAYLLDAGIDPRGLHGFFEILKEEQKSAVSAVSENSFSELLSTHPLTDNRMDAMDELMQEFNIRDGIQYDEIIIDYDAFKTRITEIMNAPNDKEIPESQ